MPYKDKEKQKACWRKYYSTHKEIVAKQRRKQQRKIKALVNSYKKRGCEICKIKHEAVIDFHHKDPNKKEENISLLWRRGWGLARVEKEIKKCNILCANCHRILHWKQRKN